MDRGPFTKNIIFNDNYYYLTVVKCMSTRRKFKGDFLEDKASKENDLFTCYTISSSTIVPSILGHPVY